MTDDFEPAEITDDTDAEDAVPADHDQVPDVREDAVTDDDDGGADPTVGDVPL